MSTLDYCERRRIEHVVRHIASDRGWTGSPWSDRGEWYETLERILAADAIAIDAQPRGDAERALAVRLARAIVYSTPAASPAPMSDDREVLEWV